MNLNKVIIEGIELIPWLNGFQPFTEGDEVVFTGSTVVQVLPTPKRYGFEITVNDGKQTLYQQLLALAQTQYSNQTIQGLNVEDYISPDSGLVTVRRMLILDLKQVGGSVRYGSQNLTKGTTIRMIEIAKNIRF